jgi:hypothetical protein
MLRKFLSIEAFLELLLLLDVMVKKKHLLVVL